MSREVKRSALALVLLVASWAVFAFVVGELRASAGQRYGGRGVSLGAYSFNGNTMQTIGAMSLVSGSGVVGLGSNILDLSSSGTFHLAPTNATTIDVGGAGLTLWQLTAGAHTLALDNTGALKLDGSALTPGGSGPTPGTYIWDPVAWAKANGVLGSSGNDSNGCVYHAAGSATITGVKWWHPSGSGSTSYTVDLWNSGGTKVNTKTVTATAGAINSVTFASSTQIGDGSQFSISVYDGSHQPLFSSAAGPFGSSTAPNTVIALGLILNGCGFGGGETAPSSTSTNYYGIEPVFTQP